MPIEHLTEEFRPVEDFPGYRVSNHGRVQTCFVSGRRGVRDEAQWKDRQPYLVKKKHGLRHLAVMLYRDGKYRHVLVHRLVLSTFFGPCPSGMQCLHGDGNPLNNRVDNLRWGTAQENSDDSVRHGAMRRGSRHGIAKLDEERVAEMKRLRDEGMIIRDLASRFGVSVGTVCNIVNGRVWKHVT